MSCSAGFKCACLQELQHGHAHHRVKAVVSHELLFQAHRLAQVCVRLAQDEVQVQSILHCWHTPLHNHTHVTIALADAALAVI